MPAVRSPSRRLSGAILALTFGGALAVLPGRAEAAGFANGDQSPAGIGLAGAMTARADDASAIYYNPAGLGFQKGLSFLGGITLINPSQTTTDASGSKWSSTSVHLVLPTLFLAGRINDKISLGVGAFVAHGGGADWQNPDNPGPFPGRFFTLRTKLQGIEINPTATLRLIPEISIGVGLDIELGAIELNRALALGGAEGQIALSGNTVAYGWNFGGLGRLLDGRLNLGITFRSSKTLRFTGMQVGVTAPPGVSLMLPYTEGAVDVRTPNIVTLGIAGQPLRWMTVSADFIATLWGDVHELIIVLSDGKGTSQSTINPRSWKDAYSGRLGVEFDIGAAALPRSKLWPKLRVGFGYDQSPVPASTIEPSSPDSDRILAAAGVSLGYRGIGSLELSYQAIIFRSRTSENPNLALTYDTNIHVFSAAINIQLEKLGKRSPAFAARLLEASPPPPRDEIRGDSSTDSTGP